jgi:hypothetical protein
VAPFLTDRFLTDPVQLRWYRPLYRLRSRPPERPAKPVSGRCGGAFRPRFAPEASTGLVAAPEAVEDDAVLLGGVTMQLDIRFWRGRWFWRLAVKAAVRSFPRKMCWSRRELFLGVSLGTSSEDRTSTAYTRVEPIYKGRIWIIDIRLTDEQALY